MKTKIEWCKRLLPDGTVIPGFSFNPWWGCQKVSEGCGDCYAFRIAGHYHKEKKLWGPPGTSTRLFFGEKHWQEPLKWNRFAHHLGHRCNVFCASMADVFEVNALLDSERARLWPLIEETPWLNWLLLTKRPDKMMEIAPWGQHWPENVWVGTSVESQKWAKERIPALLDVPAQVRFLSCEPLLGPLDLSTWLPALHWCIVGGESGSDPRPMVPEWASSLQTQCEVTRTPFFFKQWGGRYHDSGGRLLAGRTWDEMPPEFSHRGEDGRD